MAGPILGWSASYRGLLSSVNNCQSCLSTLVLAGVEEDAVYHLDGEVYTGSQLMHTGLSIRHGDHVGDNKDFTSCLMVLQKQQ